jgi:predicted aspartyl protease
MWPYNQQLEPPAPFIDIAIRHPHLSDRTRLVAAKLDTGADLSAIPQSVAAELQLLPAQTILVQSFDGSLTRIDTFAVAIEIAQARIRTIEVILIPDEHALIGRDILNHFYVQLNGPPLTFDLRLTPP